MNKLKRSTLSVLYSFLAIASFALTAKAEDQIDFVIMDQMPYGAIGPDNQIDGYLAEIAQLLLERAGMKSQLRIIPLKRLIVEGKKREFDCTIVGDTPVAKSFLEMIAPLGLQMTAGILPRQGVEITRYEDLRGKKIGVPLGISAAPKFDSDKTLEKVPAANYSGGVRMLERGRIDAVYGSFQSLAHGAILLGIEPADLFGKGLPLTVIDLHLGCVPDSLESSSIETLKRAVEDMIASGVIEGIGDRYNVSHDMGLSN